MRNLRNKIAWILIRIANKIKPSKDYYDFGDDIRAVQVFQNKIFVATISSMYMSKDKGATWYKVPRKNIISD